MSWREVTEKSFKDDMQRIMDARDAATEVGTRQWAVEEGLTLDVEFPEEVDVVDEDWLAGVSCNPNAPEECESCQ